MRIVSTDGDAADAGGLDSRHVGAGEQAGALGSEPAHGRVRGAAGAGGSLARAALGSVGVRSRSERVAAGRTSRHLKRD